MQTLKIVTALCLAIVAQSIFLPIQTNSSRCMVIYSTGDQETIKLNVKFPKDQSINQHYDYQIDLVDSKKGLLKTYSVSQQLFRHELEVPDKSIYEVCIKIMPNQTKSNSTVGKYQGEVLVEYSANTHFIAENNFPHHFQAIAQQNVSNLSSHAQQLKNISGRFIQLQNQVKAAEDHDYDHKKEMEENIEVWSVIEIVAIMSIGAFQFVRMKNRVENCLSE